MDTANAVQTELQREQREGRDSLGVMDEAPYSVYPPAEDDGCTDSALCGDITWGGPEPAPDAMLASAEDKEAETLDSNREDIESDFAGN